MKARRFNKYLIFPLIALAILPVIFETVGKHRHSHFDGTHLNCVITLKGWKSDKMNFPVGYNYELLQHLGEDLGFEVGIRLSEKGENVLDSLIMDSVTLVVMPYADSLLESRETIASKELADGSTWVLSAKNRRLMKQLNEWLHHHELMGAFRGVEERFRPSYNPYRRVASGKSFKNASPYDRLFKEYAQKIGWDWRMLASLVWKESNFRIEAVSHKGAEGLMQMMPRTARAHNNDDMLDPEKNIAAATDYIARLTRLFKPYAANRDELMNFTLAAYNAGEGRIMDCIRLAQARDLPYSTWDDIQALILMMRDDSILEEEAVKLGKFKGYETINYIREMQTLYEAFRIIAPEPSSQDRPVTQKDTVSAAES